MIFGRTLSKSLQKVLQPLSEYIRLASENASTTYASVSNMGFPQQLPRCSCPAPPGNWSLAGLRRGAQVDKGSFRRISLRAGVLVATGTSPIWQSCLVTAVHGVCLGRGGPNAARFGSWRAYRQALPYLGQLGRDLASNLEAHNLWIAVDH